MRFHGGQDAHKMAHICSSWKNAGIAYAPRGIATVNLLPYGSAPDFDRLAEEEFKIELDHFHWRRNVRVSLVDAPDAPDAARRCT